jgi:hypothetical protein
MPREQGDTSNLLERWAEGESWQQVAHVDPLLPNPIVGEDTRQPDRRLSSRLAYGRQLFRQLNDSQLSTGIWIWIHRNYAVLA